MKTTFNLLANNYLYKCYREHKEQRYEEKNNNLVQPENWKYYVILEVVGITATQNNHVDVEDRYRHATAIV